jgi:hypothetical protein
VLKNAGQYDGPGTKSQFSLQNSRILQNCSENEQLAMQLLKRMRTAVFGEPGRTN